MSFYVWFNQSLSSLFQTHYQTLLYPKAKEIKCEPQHIYVAVKFLSQVIFLFLLFLGMVMYANQVETKEK